MDGLTGNTLNSHRLIAYAGQQGWDVQDRTVEELFKAYFTQVSLLLAISVHNAHSPCQSLNQGTTQGQGGRQLVLLFFSAWHKSMGWRCLLLHAIYTFSLGPIFLAAADTTICQVHRLASAEVSVIHRRGSISMIPRCCKKLPAMLAWRISGRLCQTTQSPWTRHVPQQLSAEMDTHHASMALSFDVFHTAYCPRDHPSLHDAWRR